MSSKRSTTRLLAVASAAVFAAAALGGCGKGSSSAAASSTAPYTIGLVAPLSGGLAYIGKVQLDALNAVVKHVNAQGGVNGHQITVTAEDAADAPASVTAFRKLAQENVVAIYGPPISNSLQAVTTLAAQLKISVITPGNTAATLVPAQKYIFQMDASTTSDAQPMVRFTNSLLPDKALKLATAHSDTPASAAWATAVAKSWGPKFTMSVLHDTVLPLTAADLSSQAPALVAGGPDAILLQVSDSGATTLIPALRQRGFTGPIVTYFSTGSEPTLTKLNDPNLWVEKDIVPPGIDAGGKAGITLYNQLINDAGHMTEAKGNPLYSRGYLGGLILVEALKKCGGTCTAQTVNDALNNLSFDTQGLTPVPVKLTADVHQAIGQAQFWRYMNGKLELAMDGKAFPSSVYDNP